VDLFLNCRVCRVVLRAVDFSRDKSDGFGRERTRDLGFQRPARKPLDHRSRFRSPDRPASSQSLYRLRYLAHPQHILQKLKEQIIPNDNHKTWTTFTYYSSKLRKTTNIFKNINIIIAFRSTNTIKHLTKRKTNNTTPLYDKCGFYQTCNNCHRPYIGQTKRSLKLRYQEHIRYNRNNNPQSAYALHILNNRHEYCPIHNTMELLKQINKTKLLIPYEQLYIQSHHITNN
jgi:hypothetical protein